MKELKDRLNRNYNPDNLMETDSIIRGNKTP